MGRMGESMEEYRKLGGVRMVGGMGKFLVVGSSIGGNMERVGKRVGV